MTDFKKAEEILKQQERAIQFDLKYSLFKKSFENCCLDKDTIRMTDPIISKKEVDYIDDEIAFGNDSNPPTDYNVGSTYGCCERKMIPKPENGYDTNCEIYSRWAPCYKCQPAIARMKSYKYFAYGKDRKDWQNKGVQLKEYNVSRGYRVREV